MRNIEIKARVNDIEEVERKAKNISDTPLLVIKQHDIFFKLPSEKAASGGRLKMRQFEDGTGVLIYYERPDISGPKLSTYSMVKLDQQQRDEMINILTLSNGILGAVKKTRHLYMVKQTRIHIDKVSDLGNFMELEVVLDESDDLKKGQEIAEDLMNKLGIEEDCLLTGAYLDMLINK